MKNYKIIIIALLAITCFARAEEATKFVFSHDYLDRGILYSMYSEYAENNTTCVNQWTIHINTDGDLIKTAGWTYPYQETKNKTVGSAEKVVYAPKRMPKGSKLQVHVVDNKLFLSGYGTADIYEAQTNILVVKDIQVDGEKQRIDLPITFDYYKEYYIQFIDWNSNFSNSILRFNQ